MVKIEYLPLFTIGKNWIFTSVYKLKKMNIYLCFQIVKIEYLPLITNGKNWIFTSITVNSDIYARILLSRIVWKDTFATFKFRNWDMIYVISKRQSISPFCEGFIFRKLRKFPKVLGQFPIQSAQILTAWG